MLSVLNVEAVYRRRSTILQLNDKCSLEEESLEKLYNSFYGKVFGTEHEFKHLNGTNRIKRFVKFYNGCLNRAAVTSTKFDLKNKNPVVSLFVFMQYVVLGVCDQEDLANLIVEKLHLMESKYLPIALYGVMFVKVMHELHAAVRMG